jgi:C-terminal processing protease CtpA/Prc
VTIARWLTPNGRSISKAGLEPTLTIKRTAEQVIAGEDPQLDAALSWLGGNKDVASYTVASSSDVFAE